jgi:capsular polysaccharide biosynthesis protein
MEIYELTQLIRRNYKTVVLTVFLFVFFATAALLLRPLEYAARSRLLIQEKSTVSLDPYAAAKNNEYLGSLLTKVVDSDMFFEEVTNAGFNIDKGYFGRDLGAQLSRWTKTVEAKSVPDAGIIEISVYHEDKYQAEQIAQAINYVLRTNHGAYDGRGESASIKIINRPVASDWPVRPNLPFNLAIATLLGFVFGIGYVWLSELRSSAAFDRDVIKNVPETPQATGAPGQTREEAKEEYEAATGRDYLNGGFRAKEDLTADVYSLAPEEAVSEGGYLSEDFYPGETTGGEAKEMFGEGDIKNLFGGTV